MSDSQPSGLLAPGNIDLEHRPMVKNADGTTSTVLSMSFEEDGAEILIPSVSPDGRVLSDADAIDLYHQSGQFLGKFRTPDDATAYAERLHNDQAKFYGLDSGSENWKGWRLADPTQLPKSVSDGPQTWGEAFSDLAASTDETQRIIENTTSDLSLLNQIYDRHIGTIERVTGEKLENPMQEKLFGVPVPDFLQPPFAAAYEPQRDEFETRVNALREKYPALNSALAESVDDERTRLMREADQKNRTAAASPELGTVGRFTAQLLGGLKGAARDPFQWQMAVAGGGASGGGSVAARIGKTVVGEAMLNGGQELVLQAASQQRKRDAGLEYGMEDMLKNAGIAAVFGALFGGTVEAGGEVARLFKMGDGGAERVTRVLDDRPQPGDVEAVAQSLGVVLSNDQVSQLGRSFEEQALDGWMLTPDATPEQARVFEAAKRYAEDPDFFPEPELVERAIADESAGPLRSLNADEYERLYAGGDPNLVDDIRDTFFADYTGSPAASAVPHTSDGKAVEIGGGALPEKGVVVANIHSDGKVYIGNPGDVHFSLADRYADPEFGSPEFTGFINADGRIMSREEAFRWVAENEKPVRSSENMRDSLDALDYREQVPDRMKKPAAERAAADPIEGQTIRPERVSEPIDDAAMVEAERLAGDIAEPRIDANGNPESLLDFVPVQDGDGNVRLVAPREAIDLSNEDDFLADLMESCKL